MAEQTQTPLIGPLKQRGWREIVRFRPINNTPHVTLVVTRRGRVVGIMPAGERRVLSDYITWPYDFREVDMRERRLLVSLRLESCDAGYAFDTALALTYQVERPERVALELEDALSELEQVLAQSMRTTARSFGVEQAKALEVNLREALLYGDVLRSRLAALGLGLRRADVAVDLDAQASARAEALRAHMRERPLRAQLAIASLDSSCAFETLVGGCYRLTSRVLTDTPIEHYETSVQEAIAQTLQRIGLTFAPQQYEAAAEAMADALRRDELLQSELAAVEIELVRPTVQIQPDRAMVIAAQRALPAPADPPASKYARRSPALLPDLTGAPDGAEERPPWADLGSMFGRPTPALPAPLPDGEPSNKEEWPWTPPALPGDALDGERSNQEEISWAAPASLADEPGDERSGDTPDSEPSNQEEINWAAPAPLADEPGDELSGEETPSSPAPPVHDTTGAVERDAPPWISADIELADSAAIVHDSQHDTPVLEPVAAGDPPLAALESAIDQQQIECWVALLKADDPALFKLWSLEIMEQPQVLPTILSALTNDAATLALAEEQRYQQALVLALAAPGEHSAQVAEQAGSPAAIAPVAAEPPDSEEAPPDWLSLRQSWSDRGGES